LESNADMAGKTRRYITPNGFFVSLPDVNNF